MEADCVFLACEEHVESTNKTLTRALCFFLSVQKEEFVHFPTKNPTPGSVFNELNELAGWIIC